MADILSNSENRFVHVNISYKHYPITPKINAVKRKKQLNQNIHEKPKVVQSVGSSLNTS
jgi:hypothetical protein